MAPPPGPSNPDRPRTWLQSDRRLARYVGRPVQQFLDIEASGGILLIVATAVALVWANSPWSATYEELIHTHLIIEVGGFFSFDESLQHVINDGLMALFFFVVGLEIKREWVAGELRDRRAAVLPAFAALGGMVVPAALYLAITAGGAGSEGWGIPMATDIAFALGVVSVLGRRVPQPLKVFLLTLAIVDDVGAILVIAAVYSDGIDWALVLAAVAIVGTIVAARRARIRYHVVYIALGLGLWLVAYESGVHATIAGVVMGLLTPARPFLPTTDADAIVDQLENQAHLTAEDVHRVWFLTAESVPLTERLEHLLHPWTSYVIVPIFAFANAGIVITAADLRSPSSVMVAVVVGLVVGKLVGVSAFSWLALRMGWGTLPPGVRFPQVIGIGALAGIGFTVSLFVTALAFDEGPLANQAKLGILVASVVAACLGSLLLAASSRRDAQSEATAEAANQAT